jgi:hypothetical protein
MLLRRIRTRERGSFDPFFYREVRMFADGVFDRFYFADERFENAKPVYGAIDGDAHGEFYFDLVQKKEQGPFQATFVKGKGYVDFEGRTGPK